MENGYCVIERLLLKIIRIEKRSDGDRLRRAKREIKMDLREQIDAIFAPCHRATVSNQRKFLFSLRMKFTLIEIPFSFDLICQSGTFIWLGLLDRPTPANRSID